MTAAPEPQAPPEVTQREIAEILRTFARSGWRSMRLEVGGISVTVGKDGPPAGPAPSDPAQPRPAAAPASDIPAVAASAPPAPAPPAPAPADAAAPPAPTPAAPVDTTGLVEVRSPAVGAFWAAPNPGAAPFVQAGQTVAAHDQLAIVEVMKLMNPVVAPQAGEIVQVCVANAELVEYDQVLFYLRPADE